MTRSGRINWNFLIVFAVGILAVALTVGGLWYWNKHLRAERGLRLGTEAYENQRWDEAGRYLGQYLSAIAPEQDVEVLLKYADAQLKVRPFRKENFEQAIRAYHQILRVEENEQALRTLIELYLRTDPAEAEGNAKQFLAIKFDPAVMCYYAKSLIDQHRFGEAVTALRELIQKDPSCINAYLLLSQVAEEAPSSSDKKPMEWFTQAIEANPSDPMAYLYRARYAFRHALPDLAEADIQKIETMDLTTREQKLQLASVYLQAGQLQKTQTLLRTLQKEEPNDLLLWNFWAQWALQNGSRKEMIQVANEGMASIQPDPYDFISYAVELYIRAQQWQEARQGIQMLKTRGEKQEFITYLEGLLAEAQGNWPDAIKAWRKISLSSFHEDKVPIKLAEALEQIGDRIAAIQQLRTFLAQQPNQVKAHALLAQWCAEEGRWTEAVDHAQQAVRLQPDDPDLKNLLLQIRIQQAQATNISLSGDAWNRIEQQIHENLQNDAALRYLEIQTYIQKGKLDQAEQQIIQLEKQEGPSLQIRLLQADLLLSRQHPDEAGQVLDEAIETYPESLGAIQKRVVLYVKNKEFDPCLRLLAQAEQRLDSSQQKKTLCLWKVEVYVLADREDAAVQELKKLVQANPKDIAVRKRLLDLTRKSESPQQLRQWIQEIRGLDGDQGRQWRYEQARFLYERGDISKEYPQIVSILQGVLRDYPDDQASRILLASSHEAAGNLRLAITEYQDALARDPDNLDLVVSAVAAMYRAEEYRQAEEIIERISQRGIRDPRLSKLEAQHLLRQGKLGSASEVLEGMMAQFPDNQNVKLSLALIRLYQNRLEEASKLIDELLKASPDYLPAIAARVELFLRSGDPAKAIQVCDQAVEQFQSPKIYTLRAMTRAKAGDMQGAEEDLKQMLKLSENSTESLLLAGDMLLYVGKAAQASQLMDQALTQAANDFDVLKKAATVYARDPQRKKDAVKCLNQALAAQADDPDLRLLKARFLLDENTSDSTREAESLLAKLVDEYPRMEGTWLTLADFYYRNGQTGRAMDHVLRGLGFFPNSKALLLLKAQIEGIRSENLALPTLRNLHERFPKDDRITAIFAESCLGSGQIDSAIQILEESLKTESGSPPVLLQQIYMSALYEKGRTEEAGRLFETLEQDGKDPTGTLKRWADLLIQDKKWSSLAVLFKQEGAESAGRLSLIADLCTNIGMHDDPQARDTARKSLLYLITQYPNQPYLYVSLGRFYHYWKQYKPAEESYRKVLALSSDSDPSIQVIALNNLAWILAHEYQNYEEALQLADKGLSMEPENADLLDTRGEIYFEKGNYEEARRDLEQALCIYPFNSTGRVGSGFRLGKTLTKLGENALAYEQFKQVEQWDHQDNVLSADQVRELQGYLEKLVTN